jgi:hypothetical protein
MRMFSVGAFFLWGPNLARLSRLWSVDLGFCLGGGQLRKIVLFAFVVLTTGCASLDGNRQVMHVDSSPQGAEIFYKSRLVGTTPAPVLIDRGSEREIELKLSGESKNIKIDGDYRFKKSIFGNFAFLYYAPVGWLVDWATGAAWQMDPIPTVQFSKSKFSIANEVTSKTHKLDSSSKVGNHLNLKRRMVAIVPPLAMHANISDEIGVFVEQDIKKNFASVVEVLPYATTLGLFENEDADGESELEKEHRAYVYASLSATHLVTTKVEAQGNDFLVKGSISEYVKVNDDGLVEEKIMPYELKIPKSEIKQYEQSTYAGLDGQIFYYFPNAVTVILSDTETRFSANGVDVYGESEDVGGALGGASRFLGAISIRRIVQPWDRPGWRGSLTFTPSAGISIAREEFPDFAPVAGREFTRIHLNAAYGPTLGYGNRSAVISFSLLPAISWNEIRSSSASGEFKVNDMSVDFSAEIAVSYFFNYHWSAKIFTQSIDVPETLWEKAFSKASGTSVDVTDTALSYYGLAVSYVIPNKLFR